MSLLQQLIPNLEQAPSLDRARTAIMHRVSTVGQSVISIHQIVEMGRKTSGQMYDHTIKAGRIATMHGEKDEIQNSQTPVPSNSTSTDILEGQNPILIQAYIDGIAPSAEETKHDIEESTP